MATTGVKADMRNVNNWHWVDKNCINWTRDYFTDLLVGISHETASPNIISVSISAMSELTGDVDLNQRKGKVITIFDFAVNLKWKGNLDKVEATGNIKIPEFMHDSGVDDIVFDVTCDNETKEKQPIIAIVKKNLLPLIRENFKTFTADLINAHRGDVQIDQPKISSQYKPKPVELPMRESVVPTSVLGAVANIDLEVELIASCADIYNVLINSDKIKMWTRSKCECDAVAGGKFTLFDGNITGDFKELELNKVLGFTWRLKSWPIGHFSNVKITLIDNGDSTKLVLKQQGVPVGEKESVKMNWSQYYFQPIKSTFGYGVNLS